MLKRLKIYLFSLFAFLIADITDEEGNNIYYMLPGPNLVSFNILPEDSNIESIFVPVEDHMPYISVINEGEISYYTGNDWVGSLENLNNEGGFWIIVSDITLLNIEGNYFDPPIYFLNSGTNLISYPYSTNQSINDALPFYMLDKLIGIIGQNEATLYNEGQFQGSLTTFEPNKGYWFLLTEPVPFEYNNPNTLFSVVENTNINSEIIADYNQSIKQSIFLIDNVFVDNSSLNIPFTLSAYCNGNLVGFREWSGEMTDIIIMGNDTFDLTSGYCENNDIVDILINTEDENIETYIIGNDKWNNNEFSITSLSNYQLGNVNFDSNINVTDIILIIDYIINPYSPFTEHQIILSDINQDQETNVTDIILLLDNILE